MKYQKLWVCLLILPFVFSCTKNKKEDDESSPELFCLTDSLMQVVSLDTVSCQSLKRELLLNGRVDFDMDKVTPVYSMLSGDVNDRSCRNRRLCRKRECAGIYTKPRNCQPY